MAVTPKKMGLGTLTTSNATYYTAAGAEVLTKILLTNVSTGNVTVSLAVVPNGSAANDANRIMRDITIPGNGILSMTDLGIVMATGDFVNAVASAGGAITYRGNGVAL